MKVLDAGGLSRFYAGLLRLLGGKVDKEEGKGLSHADFTAAEKEKLSGIEERANRYVHPQGQTLSSGMYKVTVDALGHVTAGTAVRKSDITALGTPASNTTYSSATQSKAGLMSPADKIKLDSLSAMTASEIESAVQAAGL